MRARGQKCAYIRTFGCQMNEHDSKKLGLMLEGLGYALVGFPDEADLVLYNTCTIREKAYHKAISEIGRTKLLKQKKEGLIVAVCGCVAQQVGDALLNRYPHIDIVFGPDQLAVFPALLKEALSGGSASACELVNDPLKYVFLNNVPQKSETRASEFVSIMKGCNCACSYCIVPSVRGRQVSRSCADVVSEVSQLVQRGVKEVVLLGQNVNAYEYEGYSFAKLLRAIAQDTQVERIRFTSPHPRDVSDDLIDEYRNNMKLMPHIHLPVQAGSNGVLKKMRRGYTRERYLEICGALYSSREGMSITTDIIVGFCSETEKDFDETIDLMQRVKFDSAFAFKYSPRPGTEAAEKFDDDVPEKEKEKRLEQVLALQRELTLKKNNSLVGSSQLVLAVEKDQMDKGFISGRMCDNHIVHFTGKEELIGNIVPIIVKKANANSLVGEAC